MKKDTSPNNEDEQKQPKASMAELKPSDAENHYKELLEFFKNLIWLTGIALAGIVSVGMWVFYSNFRDAKTDAAESISNLKASATDQISKVREEAERVAIEEARKRIDSIFQQTNVAAFVEAAAKRQVGRAVDIQVSKAVANAMLAVQEDITSFARMSDAAARMRIGLHAGLAEMIAFKNSTNESVRSRADGLLRVVASDYEAAGFPFDVPENKTANDVLGEQVGGVFPTIDFKKRNSVLEVIRSPEANLVDVATAFLALRKLTGVHFEMFAVDEVEKWVSQNREFFKQ